VRGRSAQTGCKDQSKAQKKIKPGKEERDFSCKKCGRGGGGCFFGVGRNENASFEKVKFLFGPGHPAAGHPDKQGACIN